MQNNHTHVPSIATSRVQSLRKFAKYTPLENNPLNGIVSALQHLLKLYGGCYHGNSLPYIGSHDHTRGKPQEDTAAAAGGGEKGEGEGEREGGKKEEEEEEEEEETDSDVFTRDVVMVSVCVCVCVSV